MDRFEGFGGNLRQPEATLKPRLPQVKFLICSYLQRGEATEATFLKVSHMREGKNAFSLYMEGVGKRLPQLPHCCVSACAAMVKPEATSKRRLPQVASGWGV
jgi:hypothetical protein